MPLYMPNKVDENAQIFIKALANTFATELSCYKNRLDLAKYKTVSLNLRVSLSDKPEFELTFNSGSYGDAIKGTDLEQLMSEAYRRANYDDKAEASIQRESDALLALPSPTEA